MTEVYLRRLRAGDHKVSYKWRNDSKVWALTGSRPDITVTEAIEKEWLERVMTEGNSMRNAICLKETDEYVGNVQLTSINGGAAEFHIFIGATEHWGKGIASIATRLMVEEGFKSGLGSIYLFVSKENKQAIAVYNKCGFVVVENDADDGDSDSLKMIVNKPK